MVHELRHVNQEQERMLDERQGYKIMQKLVDDQKLNTRKALSLVAEIKREQAQSNIPSSTYSAHQLNRGQKSMERLRSDLNEEPIYDQSINRHS